LDFESAGPPVIKSIRQCELLNGWLALFARGQSLPQLEDYRPKRIDEERPDVVNYSVGGFELKNLMRGNDAVPTRPKASRRHRLQALLSPARPHFGRPDRIQPT
jgi:hypothetical protein